VLRDALLLLEDIVESCARILRYTEGKTFEQFRSNDETFDAVCRNLELIGEAAKHVPETVRLRHPQVDSRRIAGLRDVLAHGYFALEPEMLWSVVRKNVPEIASRLPAIIAMEQAHSDRSP
jgi:uncharacterized protein with HEPN domain